MAEIITNNKKNIKVDLTPMVDLGFILITFFVFTATLQQHHSFKLIIPQSNTNILMPLAESKVITIMPISNEHIGWYAGKFNGSIQYTNWSIHGIRKVIATEKSRIDEIFKTNNELTVIIKPGPESNFGNFIDVLDEITIQNIKKYVVADMDTKELAAIIK
jgi:biopolymer transport protein ExbD